MGVKAAIERLTIAAATHAYLVCIGHVPVSSQCFADVYSDFHRILFKIIHPPLLFTGITGIFTIYYYK